MSTLTHDVIIIGGGLVGASLACALSGQGLRIAGIEAVAFKRRSESSYDDRSLSLAWGSRRIFETLGIWQPPEYWQPKVLTLWPGGIQQVQ